MDGMLRLQGEEHQLEDAREGQLSVVQPKVGRLLEVALQTVLLEKALKEVVHYDVCVGRQSQEEQQLLLVAAVARQGHMPALAVEVQIDL
jgi:hypothetical protein